MGDKRGGSTRIKDIGKKAVVDVKTREKRQRRQLEALENDNFHTDPHEQLNAYVAKAKLPSFNDSNESRKRKKTKLGEIFKQKAKRSFQALVEELQSEKKEGVPTYLTCAVGKSLVPPRHFCSVCGFLSKYTCTTCGTRYCCINCLKTHKDTRCMKYTA